ncbi:triphosphoribosyl-dephospho-CoA synthase [Pluralibacter gergoviae]|uniref:2-(5''-triphosphoribosyl)-3'-dephosphocoenzyme-A synthase n=1 Tax=Pluralibacter gergoviae TaxID=61647 RepID=A0AAW8HR46_PLUGE|nr:triphosphoribosyl-dephospho-CoA synthase [Pluralibacter gergoviae]AVR04367.1 triphosphoribosyl-dephospho-CoA synthase [Pluralibacter gergoviae]KMK02799.1 2-(5'-triphosphoribosyl)-3'-dephospho CoA synthase [Pluralibacter gergoviae]KMK25461.1 2-(5'-triphosphoribosyl)-3'-dephospho CoA synthase [Pluralibacter gergoviae]MCK1067078.1 triphosphoribosyl-dephospho-CoA synthase [Pluralibacter gergoviae]MCV7760548.1 triphosphoribosyl-dephospho-CoA synthase [Pluralibacter gergoviae]
MKQLSQTHAEAQARRLADAARNALIEEARLSPKPGLVDSRGNGAHRDLTLSLMERSAHSLAPTFLRLAQHSWQRPVDVALRETVGRLGRDGEQQMLAATGGVNTHRGAIWALGLLVSASAMHGATAQAQQVANSAAALAALPDARAPKVFSNGLKASRRWQVPGAREEAQAGFPHVMQLALPQLRQSRARGAAEEEARLDALMAVMTSLSDTCVLSRAGMIGLKTMQRGARAVLHAGGCATAKGRDALARLDAQMLALNASPGGAADLLAAALFIDRVCQPAHHRIF